MALNEEIALLAMLPALGTLGQPALRRLVFSAQTRILRRGEVLYRKGEIADGAFMVISGHVELDSGHPSSPPQIVGGGVLLGELALLIDLPWPATATAHEVSSIMKIPRPLIRGIFEEFPEAAEAFRNLIAGQLASLSTNLEGVRRKLQSIDEA